MAPVWDWAGEAALAVVTLGVEQAASQFNGLGK